MTVARMERQGNRDKKLPASKLLNRKAIQNTRQKNRRKFSILKLKICFFKKLPALVQNSVEFGGSFDFGESNSSTVTVTRNLRGATTLLTRDM
jgi:hypothetical protein